MLLSGDGGARPDPRFELVARPIVPPVLGGEAISLLGSQVTLLALPLAAVLLLDAGPGEMAILGLLTYLPFLVVTLPAGVWADRRRRRPLLLVANIGRAAALLAIPVSAALGVLSLPLLYVVTLVVGVLTVVFEVGYLSYVPSLVARHRLADANARLQATSSAAEVGGPGIAGLLIAAVGAPLAILIASASYLASAVLLFGIDRQEPEPAGAGQPSDILGDIRTGLRVTFTNPILRAFALEAATNNLAWQVVEVVLLIYAIQVLGLDALAIGTLFSIGAVGAVTGAVTAGRLGRRFGVGRTTTAAMVVCGLGTLLIQWRRRHRSWVARSWPSRCSSVGSAPQSRACTSSRSARRSRRTSCSAG